MKRVFLVPLLAFFIPAMASAWPPLSRPASADAGGANDVAIVVAVEDYLMLPDVTGAVKNANDWEVFFQRSLKVPEVHVMVNQDATREGILKFVDIAKKEVKPGGRIWFVFIGHGAASTTGDGILVGVDAQQNVESLDSRGLPQSELIAALQHGEAQTIMIIDACFSGRAPDGSALATGVQPIMPVKPTALPTNLLIFSAAQSHEVAGALEGVERPAFSYLLLGALRGWADDGDGEIHAEEALLFTRRKLRGMKGRQQTPNMWGNVDQVLTTGVSETEPDPVQALEPDSSETKTETSNTEAERTLQFLQRRIVINDDDEIHQGDTVMNSISFYHEIGRPDLAEEFMTHNPYLWAPGIAITGAGIALMSIGVALARESTGWFIGGSLGGSAGIGGGVLMMYFGLTGNYEPLNAAQRRSAAEMYNRALQESLGLTPNVAQPSNGWPLGGLQPQTRGLHVKFEF